VNFSTQSSAGANTETSAIKYGRMKEKFGSAENGDKTPSDGNEAADAAENPEKTTKTAINKKRKLEEASERPIKHECSEVSPWPKSSTRMLHADL